MDNSIDKFHLMPVVALRGLVVFPGTVTTFDVERDNSRRAINAAVDKDCEIFLVAQKSPDVEKPKLEDVFSIGVVAKIRQVFALGKEKNSPIRVTVEGKRRAAVRVFATEGGVPSAYVLEVEESYDAEDKDSGVYIEAIKRSTKAMFEEYCGISQKIPDDMIRKVMLETDCGRLSDFIVSNIFFDYVKRQTFLSEPDPVNRLEMLIVELQEEMNILSIEDDIQNKMHSHWDDEQREHFLREQYRTIGEELNGSDAEELEAYREAIFTKPLPDEVREKLLKACTRLEKYAPQSPEAAVERNYLDVCLELPWGVYSKDKLDLTAARKVLDADHYGMDKVKERIIELLAVRKLAPDITGQIICLYGPPGVGKTSVARSVARAMGRQYVRIALGGVKDEAEIRGHRKTYIGSMPGRIIDALQKAGTSNPLILLDEIDKLSSDYKGDPTSALLEVLDPEQNNSFRDHYVELPFDLSHVLFITTANLRENIPAPLQDRMEMIELGSYTHVEKFNIAKKHLIKKQLKRHGLKASQLKITDGALHAIIDNYTREAGVRLLEQQIAAICRKAAVNAADGGGKMTVKAADLKELLGTPKYKDEPIADKKEVGVANGLAWTEVGGTTLAVEAAVLEGSGKLELTGSLGNVMQESAKTAVSLIRSRSAGLALEREFYKTKDIHLHFPEGATPKDGPSAGITISTALLSALTGVPVRGDTAMTGEVTLRGKVLPIGGLKEKSMAAYRSGIKRIIIPADNVSDLDEVDPAVKEAVEFIPVTTVEEVWKAALDSDTYLLAKE